MFQFFLTVYLLTISTLIVFKQYTYVLLLISGGIIYYLCFIFYKKISKQRIRHKLKQIKNVKKKKILPFINVNTAPWYIFAELPNVSKASAKRAVYIREQQGRYQSMEDFYSKNIVSPEDKDFFDKIFYL